MLVKDRASAALRQLQAQLKDHQSPQLKRFQLRSFEPPSFLMIIERLSANDFIPMLCQKCTELSAVGISRPDRPRQSTGFDRQPPQTGLSATGRQNAPERVTRVDIHAIIIAAFYWRVIDAVLAPELDALAQMGFHA
ncbi:hypothetical protein ACFSUK_24275 [Sphingobium scionense]|uniref:Uncharacterized protein n=1 Tax=Sphingobium scionense TaxID=1404341 RepID=A0A7W6LQM2_9SPHN|nr:hypothetical protein [Sphingobium scionense]MBB4147803.1 hypothetical protein [Sphingobium scionense]